MRGVCRALAHFNLKNVRLARFLPSKLQAALAAKQPQYREFLHLLGAKIHIFRDALPWEI
jgi:hypothetical protein